MPTHLICLLYVLSGNGKNKDQGEPSHSLQLRTRDLVRSARASRASGRVMSREGVPFLPALPR